MMNQPLRILFLFAILMASACGMQKTPAQQSDEKASGSLRMDMQDMDPQFLYLAAQDALKEGKQALAINLLTALVSKDAKAIDPHMQLVSLLIESGQTDQAEQHLATLLAQKELQAEQIEQLELTRIRLHLAKSQTDKALKAVNAFLATHPSHINARDVQARIFSSQKRYDEALAAIAEAIQAADLPGFRLLQAQLLLKKNDIASAKTSLNRMRELAPEDDTPIVLLSALAIQENNTDEAEKLLRDFLADNPHALRVTHALGRLLIQDNRLVEAILIYRDAATRSGNNPDILRQLGMLYFRHKDYAEMEDVFRKLVDIRPDDASHFYLAASLETLDRIAEAKAIYQRIDQTSVLATEAQLRLAAIEISNNGIEKAIGHLQSILQQKPAHLDAHLMLSAIRLNQKRYQQLLDETEVLLSKPRLPEQLLFNRAVSLEHFKRHKQLDATLNRILGTNPNHAEALNFLGYSYAVQGIKLDQAVLLIQRALIQKPDDGYYLDSLAWVYFQKGDYAKAIKLQSKALKQIPDDTVMYEHYGDILWKIGQQDAARKAWQKAIDLKSTQPEKLKQKIAHGLETRP